MTWPPQPPDQQRPGPAPGARPVPPVAPAAIALTSRHSRLNFAYGGNKPSVLLDGQLLPVTGWGRYVYPVQPGLHWLRVHLSYRRLPGVEVHLGVAERAIPVHPGQTVELEYRPPLVGYLSGALGPPPQRSRGITTAVVLCVTAVALVTLVIWLGSR